jgi:hypothetical protein
VKRSKPWESVWQRRRRQRARTLSRGGSQPVVLARVATASGRHPPPYPPGGIDAPRVDHAIAPAGMLNDGGCPHALNVTVLVALPPVDAVVEE